MVNKNTLLKAFAILIDKLFFWINVQQRVNLFSELILALTKNLPPEDRLKVLLDVDNRLYFATGKAAQLYGNSIHPKQRLINYKNFFISNVRPGERVLDVGCGNGYNCFNVARSVSNVSITGLDINLENLAAAKKVNARENVTYTHGNIYEFNSKEKFDIVIMSAILEHLENRVALLKNLISTTGCRALLIRVPAFDRDWRVPLKVELGLDYRLDHTHCLEYTEEKLIHELALAGMKPKEIFVRWGEIYGVFVPN